MFYSHEILTSKTYGVATVWLVSTLGFKSSTRKISRKAIQEVDVQKACETIQQPGAPIALRLQGSLLYGVSRVYLQQCQYVLSDAERVQAHMRAFYRALGGSDNALDSQAGKSRRRDLILEDDPEFDPNPNLPAMHFDDDGNLVIPQTSQISRKTSSLLSPLQPDGSFSSSNRSILGGFDLSHSPFGGGGIITEPFGAGTMTPGKEGGSIMLFGDEERELQALDDWGIEIDAEGNILPAVEEPQLPRLPQSHQEEEGAGAIQLDELIQIDDQGDLIMGGAAGGNVFHSDPPLPAQLERQPQEQQLAQTQEEREIAAEEEIGLSQGPVRARRKRRRPILTPDEQTKITRQELKAWSANYLDNAEQASQVRLGITQAEARKRAFDLVFGRGIAGVGFLTGIPGFPHPLASNFAGDGLQARLLGIVFAHPGDGNLERPRGRRRSAVEALGLEQGDAERRIRRRLSDEGEEYAEFTQHQLAQHGGDALPLPGDDEIPPVEVGRRAGSALPDVSSDVPWNRPSSQVPSSSIKGAGAGSRPPSRQVSASPLHGRGGLPPVILGPELERFSDNVDDVHQPLLGSDGFAPLHSGPAGSFDGGSRSSGFQDLAREECQQASQQMRAALDREGRNFLAYVEAAAREKGSADDSDDDDNSKRWLLFEALFEAEDRKRSVVAQAFYHVLSLATKNVIQVRQDGQGGNAAFGPIRLGVEVPPLEEVVEDAEGMEDAVEGPEH
ncbi:hypothetical protein VTH82DRAFT_7997 [Thermothelomyces myriococcoides]